MSKTIVITGASSGIGKATAKYFAEKGWNVAATMRSPEKETELQQFENIKLFKLDVTDNQTIASSYQDIIKAFGTVDVLLNNAGYGLNGPLELISDAQIKREYEVNVFGLMNVIKAYLPHFREQKDGVIINVTSGAGRIGIPFASVYASSKFAVEGLSESLTFELKKFGIKVKVVEPGAIKTDFNTRSMDLPENADKTDAYNQHLADFSSKVEKLVSNASEPVVVAEAIYTAATDQSEQLRYTAGEDVKMILAMKDKLGAEAHVEIMQQLLGE